MAFITDSFLLHNETGRRLYRTYAAGQPILDYHCHLSARDIAENRRFQNLYEIWLEGDHYKWRAMRANGITERYCTGDGAPYDKFLAWARTVPATLRNPLYHWTHLELLRYFGITELLDETTAPKIWESANRQLGGDELTAQGILKQFGVVALCTTNDPTDSLSDHQKIRRSNLATRVLPTFRPDEAFKTDDPVAFNNWVDRLGASANLAISRFIDFLDALRKRHDHFHEQGCRLSDHGLDHCYAEPSTEGEAAGIFDKLRSGNRLIRAESDRFASFLMLFFGHLDTEKGWTKQLHLGAYRNANTRARAAYGADAGFDAMGDWMQTSLLLKYLDSLDRDRSLPATIVYCHNPADNYAFATAVGSFQGEGVAGKIQFGSAWWFLDQKEGIQLQLNALSTCGLLSRFIGMTTDSRSFMSYPRHDYFRRVLCNLLGSEMESGELPGDEELIGGMIRNICYKNAECYLNLAPGNSR